MLPLLSPRLRCCRRCCTAAGLQLLQQAPQPRRLIAPRMLQRQPGGMRAKAALEAAEGCLIQSSVLAKAGGGALDHAAQRQQRRRAATAGCCVVPLAPAPPPHLLLPCFCSRRCRCCRVCVAAALCCASCAALLGQRPGHQVRQVALFRQELQAAGEGEGGGQQVGWIAAVHLQ